MTDANFSGVNLIGMSKFETLLNIASFVGADLSQANTRGLTGNANFDGANLS